MRNHHSAKEIWSISFSDFMNRTFAVNSGRALRQSAREEQLKSGERRRQRDIGPRDRNEEKKKEGGRDEHRRKERKPTPCAGFMLHQPPHFAENPSTFPHAHDIPPAF